MATDERLRGWQVRIFSLLWMAYASYYLCRLNFAVAQPAILLEFPDWTRAEIGVIPSVYFAVYAVGQFVNGQLAERFGTRAMMTSALVVAALANLGFSQVESYHSMLVLWGLNGWAQSAGWSLVVATMAAWTTAGRRGRVIGLISTCYQIGNVVSWLLAGYLSDAYDWRATFWVPGLFLLPVAVVFGVFLRNRPEDAGFAPVREDDVVTKGSASTGPEPTKLSAGAVLRLTLTNRILWILAVGFFCANSVRYAFMNWAVQYMHDYQGQTIKGSAFMAVALPLIGSAGAVSSGWISDTMFGGRRAPPAALMLMGLSAVCVAFAFLPTGQATMATAMLGLAGFLIYGPDMLISGAATVDFSHPRAAAAATGLTMSTGAAGAIFSGAGVGWIWDMSGGEWSLVFYVLAGLALVPAMLMVSLWRVRPKAAGGK
jgi:OPA family sugar phosphate sensor protein UhpC-like MFS transporter